MVSQDKANESAPKGPALAPPKAPPAPGVDGAGEALGPTSDKPEPKKPDPTRYGDWEKNGRCIDF